MNKAEIFDSKLQELSRFGVAISHPARLMILQFIAANKECLPGEIANHLPLNRTTVNQHLKELLDSGLIQIKIIGVKRKYCLCPEETERSLNQMISFFGTIIKQKG
jgi:ArsR family transcriptional regulator, arsenate/arsenite/antimonite-responsive transcriptional repressor